MILVIDTDGSPLNYTQITQIDGVEYLFQFQWSFREGCFYIGLFDQDGNPLALGIRLVVSWPLLRRWQFDPRIPKGVLMCVDMTGQSREIESPSDLNTRVKLMYTTPDDPSLA